jgi:hypothetical protein
MKKNIISIFIGVILFSCTKMTDNTNFKFHASVSKVEEEVNFNDIVEDYKYIKLETSKNCLLGDTKKMLFYKSKIFILTTEIYCFNLEGKFLYAVDKKGKGPSEFIRIDNMSVDNDKIYLYDNSQWRILCFDANNGNFLKSVKLGYSVPTLECVDDYLFIDRAHFPNKFVKGNERLLISTLKNPDKILFEYFPEKKYELSVNNQFYGYNKQIYFANPYQNQIYKIHNDKVEKFFFLDFGEKNLTEAEESSLVEDGRISSEQIKTKNKAYFIQNVFETSSFITAELSVGKDPVHVIYDKDLNYSIAYKKVNTKIYIAPPSACAVYEDYFCNVIPSSTFYIVRQLSTEKVSIDPNDTDFKCFNIFNNVKVDDNPIIVMYKLKTLKSFLENR